MESDSWAADAITCLPLCEAVYSNSRPTLVEGAFSCSICHEPFTDMTTFVCHVQNHTEEKYGGDKQMCLQTNESKELPKLESNMAMSPKFTCAICLMSFPSDFSLINHVSRHSTDEAEIPTLISKKESLDLQQNMDQDVPTVSNSDSALSLDDLLLFTCAICNKSLGSDKDLALHVKGHSSECDIKVTVGAPRQMEALEVKHTVTRSTAKAMASMQSNNSTLAYSSKRKKIQDLLSFQCTICNKYFKNDVSLKIHKKQHAPEEEQTDSKPIVASPTPDMDEGIKPELVTRKVVKVPGEVPSTFKCAICDKLFTNESALIVHVGQHASAKQHECTLCHKTFKCQSHLSRHERIHLGVRPFSCPVCTTAFSRRSHLSTHLRLHRGERPFPCTTCNKTFTDGSNLAKHLRLHSQEKSHRCETCDRVFGRSDTLAKHRRSHSGAKPYQCQLCARLFPRQDSLARHLKSHRGEKPHQCIVCSKAFTQKYDLTLHYRTHARNFTLPGGWGLDALSVPELQLPATQ